MTGFARICRSAHQTCLPAWGGANKVLVALQGR
jgi:hypothetical protein